MRASTQQRSDSNIHRIFPGKFLRFNQHYLKDNNLLVLSEYRINRNLSFYDIVRLGRRF